MQSQQLVTTNYDQNNGIIPIQLGNARVITGYKRLLHVINLTSYHPIISNIKTNVNKILDTTAKYNKLHLLYNQRAGLLSDQASQLLNTLQHIKPRSLPRNYYKRNKRGLIDGLGSVIKGITGNLDQNDYKEISEALANINLNEDILTQKLNEQVNINTQMTTRFNEIRKILDTSTTQIEKQLASYQNASKDMLEIASFEQFIYLVSYTIDHLQNHLDSILATTTHAKLQIISHHLLNKKELIFVDEQLQSQNVYVHSGHNIYELLHLKAYYNQSLIIFSIEIPIFHEALFKQYYLQPTNINNTYSIDIPHNHLIFNDHFYQFMTKSCDEVENEYYCQKEDLQPANNNCIAQIILNKPAHCNLIQSTIPDNIAQLFVQYLYISTRKSLEFTTTCGTQNRRHIEGIKLIQMRNCSILINNTVYTNTASTFYEEIVNLQPFHEINTKDINISIDLPRLNNWTIANMKRLDDLHHSVALANHQNIAWVMGDILFACIFGYLILIEYYPECTIRQCCKKKQHHQILLLPTY